MKKLAVFLVSLLLLCGGAFAQTSDYEIITTYKNQHQSLLDSIKAAQDLGECSRLEGEIARLEADYSKHQKLLGDSLHPGTFDSSISALRDQVKKSTERIAAIERSRKAEAEVATTKVQLEESTSTIVSLSEQNANYKASIDRMTQEMADLTAKVEELSATNAGLVQQIRALQQENRQDKESIAKLKALTDKLTANIRDRDDLILKMMDSFVGEYSKPGLSDAQRKNLFVNAQGNDYAGKIIATIDENVKYAEATLLSPQDVEVIKMEQSKLSAKWGEIKPYVEKLYPDVQVMTRDVATVESGLSTWKGRIDEATWKGLHQFFLGQNVDIGAFRSAEEFQDRLLAYIDNQAKNPSRAEYRGFRSKVWDSPTMGQWLNLIPAGELTALQKAGIDERIGLWGKKVDALFWRWILIGVFGVAVIAVIVVVLLRKKKPQPPASLESTTQIR